MAVLGVLAKMSKYGDKNVVDLSEWGRPIARIVSRFLKEKPISVMQVTTIHLLLTIYCAWLILEGNTIIACFLLIIKGIIDAVDGELARIRERPSHVGRYWDTVAEYYRFDSSHACIWKTIQLGNNPNNCSYFCDIASIFTIQSLFNNDEKLRFW